jgi:hypothetical protein
VRRRGWSPVSTRCASRADEQRVRQAGLMATQVRGRRTRLGIRTTPLDAASITASQAPLAQLAEQRTLNPRVRGSSPWRRTRNPLLRPAISMVWAHRLAARAATRAATPLIRHLLGLRPRHLRHSARASGPSFLLPRGRPPAPRGCRCSWSARSGYGRESPSPRERGRFAPAAGSPRCAADRAAGPAADRRERAASGTHGSRREDRLGYRPGPCMSVTAPSSMATIAAGSAAYWP